MANSMEELTFREAAPGTDLSHPKGAGYSNETYRTGAISINTWTFVFDTGVIPTLDQRQIAVFYELWNLTRGPSVTAVRFRQGPDGVTTLGWFPCEFLNAKKSPDAYFDEPIVYGPGESIFIECIACDEMVRPSGERLGFGCYIAETREDPEYVIDTP